MDKTPTIEFESDYEEVGVIDGLVKSVQEKPLGYIGEL